MKTCLSQELYIDWNIMCLSVCGRLLPVTSLSIDRDEGILQISMTHEIAETSAPLKFDDGTVGRAVIFRYPFDDVLASDIN